MLETPHVIVGAAIATKIANPFLAIPMAVGSHFLLDKMPHWNPHLNTDLKKYGKVSEKSFSLIVVDSFLALAVGCAVAARVLPDTGHFFTIIFASLGAALPDLVEAPHYFLKYRNKYMSQFIAWQKSIQFDVPPIPGLLMQGLVILVSLIVIFWN